MKLKEMVSLIVTGIVFTLLFINFKIKKDLVKQTEKIEEAVVYTSTLNSFFTKNQLLLLDRKLPKYIKNLKPIIADSTSFDDLLINNKDKLFMYFNRNVCDECIRHEISMIDQVLNMDSADFLIILSNMRNDVERSNFMANNTVRAKLFSVSKNEYLDSIVGNSLLIFFLNENLEATAFFIPNKNFAKYSILYYDRFKKNLLAKEQE
jgi:hypothetical protein